LLIDFAGVAGPTAHGGFGFGGHSRKTGALIAPHRGALHAGHEGIGLLAPAWPSCRPRAIPAAPPASPPEPHSRCGPHGAHSHSKT
jgi:hypothetical protein